MQIFNLHSDKKRKIKDLKKTSHKEYDEHGKKQTNHYIEFTIIGKNRKWVDFMSVKDFKRLNPTVDI